MSHETKHEGPRRLITYTNVNEERITRVFSAEEFDTIDPEDFRNPVILCADLPMPFAAAPELLGALEAMLALYESGAWSNCNLSEARAAIAKARGRV